MPDGTQTAHRIGYAVKQLKAGRAVTRSGWKVKGQFLTYVPAQEKAEAYLLWNTKSGRTWPATLSQRDLLAEDWQLVTV